jgi:hypothetical protein
MSSIVRDATLQSAAGEEYVASEWKPSRRVWWAWMALQVPILIVALPAYMVAATHGATSATGTATPAQMAFVVGLTIALAWVHEGVHGLAIVAFGSRPHFGVVVIDRIPVGFYATAPGHRFSRRAYSVVIIAPLVVLAPLGLVACWLPNGGYLVVPFALHLAGCVGDLTMFSHVVRTPSDSLCEDLRDGTRFWRPAA